ncbi:MAG: hypothetical protein ACE5KP_04870, partial [Dehalococcoidales bacterium]
MSKLIDRLNQVTKAVSKPIGFGRARPATTQAKMLLIASLTQTTGVGRLADYTKSADAVLFAKTGSGAKSLQRIAQSVSDIPWGLWLGDIGGQGIKAMVEAGGDFIVFPASSTLTVPENEKVGKILQVGASLSEGLLRAVNELPVDAVLIADEPGKESSLTWHHLMLFQRFAELLTKPLLASVPLKVTANELPILWKTGVDGVVVEVGIGQPVARLKELY